jgi:hypothetical protein
LAGALREHDPEKHTSGCNPTGVVRSSLAINAERALAKVMRDRERKAR